MRPNRNNIPVPPFPPGMQWAGEEPAAAERLTAKGPLLVIFFEVGELSGVESLPQVEAWSRHYAASGLKTVGIHSPRSDLARSPEAFAAAIERLGITFPVASDSEYRVWHAYGCKGWPSLFLWGLGGRLRWFHFGIGGIAETEEAIRAELLESKKDLVLPDPVNEPGNIGVKVEKPSDEVFPGGSHDTFWIGEPGEPLEVEYAGGGAWAALDGNGKVRVLVDGHNPVHEFEVAAPGLYELSSHPEHGIHEVHIELDPGIRVWSLSFVPAPAPA